ncbi:MAG: hypothetical protein R6U20_06695, partial [Longimonas sp.]|uniref:hypothetical protein n=1 Tax=Longimonas sp. TaxID=2039626 RepID=UPI003975197B
NQPDYSWIKPYEVKFAEQYWYPVKDIGGFKYANLNGAVNLEKKDDNSVFMQILSPGSGTKRWEHRDRVLLGCGYPGRPPT